MDKEKFRNLAKKRLKNSIKITAKCKHYNILKNLENLIILSKSKNVLIYMPLKYEANVYLLYKKMSQKINFFLPYMTSISFKLVKLKRPFVISRFGVKETLNQNEFTKKIDMAIIPVIGVDGRFARIGHGKGFYDKFFSNLKYKPLIVFVSIKDNFTNLIISQKHDIIGDFYITPTKKYFQRGKHDRCFNSFIRSVGWSCHRVFCGQKNK